MAMDLKEIEKHIKEAMPDASIDIQDLAGDGNHYSATVTSSPSPRSCSIFCTLLLSRYLLGKKKSKSWA